MKKWKKILLENALLISLGLILTAIGVKEAYLRRGYIAVGGEWLMLPLVILVKSFVISFIQGIREVTRL